MLRSNEKVIDIAIGEALLSLLKENADVNNKTLSSRLSLFLQAEEDANKRKAILDALIILSSWSDEHEPSELGPDSRTIQPKIFHFSALKH
ncbi:hypothetical protein JK231_24555 [Pantoea sp. JGM49]|uniref:hypothetical protein n=1 Tax=Pantoea sp. JGM49 TaxID=2799791 RepID=UPI001BAD1731|nr:hypothetical protein [Pantoea sp. JGM49]MBS0883761.1 hypothetical protein [Pantoea sp. JGM49]